MGDIMDLHKVQCSECWKLIIAVDMEALKDTRGQYHWYCPECAKRQPKIHH